MKNGISNIEERLSNIEEQIKEIQIFIKQLHVNDSLQSEEQNQEIIDDTNAEYCDMCGKFTDDLIERKSGDLFCRECHKKYCEHLKCEEVLVSIDERVVYCLDCLQEVKGGI